MSKYEMNKDNQRWCNNTQGWLHFWQCPRYQTTEASGQTRARILEAAFQEVHRVGFQAASLKNILKTTQLTKGALYHHFPNKQALGYALVDEVIREVIEQHWIKPLETADDPITALKQCIAQAGKEMTPEDIQLGCPLNNLTQEMALVDEQFRLRTESIYRDWRQAITAALERGKQQGKVKKTVDSEAFSVVYIATLEGCIGLAKSAQSMALLMSCGKGLKDLLDNLAIEEIKNA